MPRIALLILLFAALPLRAVQMNGNFDTTPPTNSDIPHWTSGWGASGITGWDYLGRVGGASAVYLGNGWVLTASHVGVGDFIQGTHTYPANGSTVRTITNSSGRVDLLLFQITSFPALPPLILSTSLPAAFSATQTGSSVAMLGFGGGGGQLTWGIDIVTETDQTLIITVDGIDYVSNDFFTDNGTTTFGSTSINNTSTLVGGDSGGGDFTFNPISGQWELTGINEVIGSYDDDPSKTFSGMVQLNTYASQINAIVNPVTTDTPAMPLSWLFVMALLFFLTAFATSGKALKVR